VDYMAEDGFVGNYNGSQAREVLLTLEQWAEMSGDKAAATTPVPAAPTRSNRLTVAKRSKPEIDEDDESTFESGELDHNSKDENEPDSDLDDDDDYEDDSDVEEDDEELEEEVDKLPQSPRFRRGRESA